MQRPIIPYDPTLRDRARELRKNMTLGERKLWQRLRRKQVLGYDFDRQWPLDRFIVDFYCKELMLAIEIDGASHDGPAARERDRERQTRLESFGIRFLRFTEGDAIERTSEVVAAIAAWIREHQGA